MTLDEMKEFQKTLDNIKPKQHHGDEEHRIQKSCVRWFRLQYPQMANLLFAIPNGGARSKREGGVKKAEGMTAGVSDLILLRSNKQFGALCIEMKTKDGKQSESQKKWQKLAEKYGSKYIVCRSLDEFIESINDYLKDIDYG